MFSFSTIVKPRNYYKLDSMPKHASDTPDTYGIWGLVNKKRKIKYIPTYEKPNSDFDSDMLSKWKVFISKADGAAGQLCYPVPARIMGATMKGGENILSTITFLAIGPLESENEASNIQEYMKTKFFRFLLGIRKLKNVYWKVFTFVPIVDFHKVWTDEELYNEFGLSPEERKHIDAMIADSE